MSNEPPPDQPRPPPPLAARASNPPSLLAAVAFVFLYALAIVVALVIFRTPKVMPAGNELSLPRSVFTIANAASLTGFQQTITVESYKMLGQALILMLMVAGSLVSMIVGGAAVTRLLRLPYSTGRIARWAVGVEVFAILVGAVGLLGGGRSSFELVFQAASAFGNCGVVIGPVNDLHDSIVHVILLPLAVVGGIGLPVLMESFDWMRFGRKPSHHARSAVAMTAGVYFIGFLIVLLMQWSHAMPKDANVLDLLGKLVFLIPGSSAAVLNSRTLGWPIDAPATWPRAMAWVVMLLMLVGASPAGTGGGLKTTTLAALARGTYGSLRGRAVSRMFGVAVGWVALYLLVVVATTMRLVSTEPQLAADQILFVAVSAVGNVGLSMAPISITGDGLYTLSVSMMLGRILPLVVLWWAALTIRDADVAVG